MLPAGDHTIPCTFNLPLELHGSFEQHFDTLDGAARGVLAYKIEGLLQSEDKKTLVYEKKHINIVKKLRADIFETIDDTSIEMNKIKFNFKVDVDRTLVSYNMPINVRMLLDNSQSSNKVKKIKWKSLLNAEISTTHGKFWTRQMINKEHLEGVKSHETFSKNFTIVFKTPRILGHNIATSYNGTFIKDNFELQS